MIRITDAHTIHLRFSSQFASLAGVVTGESMARKSLMVAIGKLAVAGEQAGFSIEQMVELLDSGFPVEALLELIAWRLDGTQSAFSTINPRGTWRVPFSSANA